MKLPLLQRLCLLPALFILSLTSLTVLAESSVWQVSKGNDHIFIAGTVHILPPSAFPLPKEFEQAYQRSDTIVLETKLPDGSDMAFQMTMMQQMTYANGKKITDVITKRTRQMLTKHLAGLGTDLIMFEHFKPGFLVTMVALLEAQHAGFSGEGVDVFYSKKASSDNKTIEYFESAEFQLQMIEKLGQGNEDRFINSNLAQLADFKDFFTNLLSAWRVGDERKLAELAITPMEADPKSLKIMLIDRNRNWVKDINVMFTDNDKEFVLVGTAHLVGPNSVLALLKAQGYQVDKL